MDESLDTRSQIIQALEKMVATGENINISAVAAKCGVSHSLIYNRYPDLKERIKELKAAHKARQKVANDKELIDTLLAKNKALKDRVKEDRSGQAEDNFKRMLVHVQQVYSMYDQLLEERNRLAERLGRA
jgi:AcrR family transcriptional regulator